MQRLQPKAPCGVFPAISSLFQKPHIPFDLMSAPPVHSELFYHFFFLPCHLASIDGCKLAYSALISSSRVIPLVLHQLHIFSRACTDSVNKNLQESTSQFCWTKSVFVHSLKNYFSFCGVLHEYWGAVELIHTPQHVHRSVLLLCCSSCSVFWLVFVEWLSTSFWIVSWWWIAWIV